jgi:hypothetical protein
MDFPHQAQPIREFGCTQTAAGEQSHWAQNPDL